MIDNITLAALLVHGVDSRLEKKGKLKLLVNRNDA